MRRARQSIERGPLHGGGYGTANLTDASITRSLTGSNAIVLPRRLLSRLPLLFSLFLGNREGEEDRVFSSHGGDFFVAPSAGYNQESYGGIRNPRLIIYSGDL
ncbi:hypothetical protein HPP92_008168 [Vanilla planifolia]|uniref:Uncharacterized protein n=1 Tax=Vanilla planifolia TaxID=51239 RepID=A0A835R966_VANPL|nr:hypothetical protein HPP92_008168 [Vanilla planifolia]